MSARAATAGPRGAGPPSRFRAVAQTPGGAAPRTASVGGRRLLIGLVVGYLALVLLLPVGALAWAALDAGLGEIGRTLLSHEARSAIGRSVILVLLALVINGAFGVAGALVLVRHRFRFRALCDALVDLPLALSPVMVGLAFLLLFGRGGWIEPILAPHIRVAFAFPGLLLCTLMVTLPFTVREVASVLEALGTTDEEAAATLGASSWRTFTAVTLPNIRRALNLGLTLTLARALGEFGAVIVVGGAIAGRTDTATTFIYAAVEERQRAAAYGMAALLAALSLVLLAALEHFGRRREA